jgi:heme oxygenase
LNFVNGPASPSSPIIRLRAATAKIHHRIEQRLDIVARLADPGRRGEMIGRFAAFHLPAEATLADWRAGIPGVGVVGRMPLLAKLVGAQPLPPFPAPANRAEALGMLYVLEGSTLGGRLILRTLARRGIHDRRLAFLDLHGADTGARWRGFLAVLARELDDGRLAGDACHGAVAAFRHAERVLCEGTG